MLLLDTPTLENLPLNLITGIETPLPCPDQAPTFDEVEARYLSAKNRLIAAQDEKAEAISEFMCARDALRTYLEEFWPDRSE